MARESDLHRHSPSERADLFEASSASATEYETQELLTALVRSFKPERILETGSSSGHGTIALARGCLVNGFGRVTTIDLSPQSVKEALERTRRKGLDSFVETVCAHSVEWLRIYDGPGFGFAFLDSDLASRVLELRILKDRRLALGPVLVHDTSRLRAAGGVEDRPDFPRELDALGLPCVENPLSRGWRLFDLRPPGA